MTIAIDGSRAFLKQRTGIEEYSYQVIFHLREELKEESVVIYIRSDQEIDFDLPEKWRVKQLWAPRLWTQCRLSLEMLFSKTDILLVPAHTVPFIHPRNTIVVVHGLEYEFCPEAYSWFARWYMRLSIWYSCKVAKTVICVSENTKKDVMRLYAVEQQKIVVFPEGYEKKHAEGSMSLKESFNGLVKTPYILFIGRLEERKNIIRYIDAFDQCKEEYQTEHQLVLVGKWGYGCEYIRKRIQKSRYRNDIVICGYVTEEEKWQLLHQAEVFLFATLYEGFGIPVLEAQSMGVPVITSATSSLPEVAGEGAILVDPMSILEITEALQQIVSNKTFRDAIIAKGYENVKRFSWEQCAKDIAHLMKKNTTR